MSALVVGPSELQVMESELKRRVMDAANKLPDFMSQRRAIISAWQSMSAALLAKFDVRDVADIEIGQFEEACNFIKTMPI